MLYNSHLLYQKDIPDLSSMNIGKLGRRGALMSDPCNGLRNMRCLIVELVYEAAEAMFKDVSDDIRVLEVNF